MPAAGNALTIGLVLVGPYNDQGWSQANYDARAVRREQGAGHKDDLHRQGQLGGQAGDHGVPARRKPCCQGAKLIIFSSDDMADEAVKFATAHPDIFVIMTSGSQVWKDGKTYQDLPNMVNIMGRMEFGKMIAGVAAAMTTQTGQIGYLGPLINDETRRLASSVYLGARYAWTNYLKKDPAEAASSRSPGSGSGSTSPASPRIPRRSPMISSTAAMTWWSPASTPPKRSRKRSSSPHRARRCGPFPTTIPSASRRRPNVNLGCPVLQLGPRVCHGGQGRDGGETGSPTSSGTPRTGRTSTAPTRRPSGSTRARRSPAPRRPRWTSLSASWPGGLSLWKGPLALQDGTSYLDARHGGHRPAGLVPAPAPAGHGGTERLEVSRISVRTFRGETELVSPLAFETA